MRKFQFFQYFTICLVIWCLSACSPGTSGLTKTTATQKSVDASIQLAPTATLHSTATPQPSIPETQPPVPTALLPLVERLNADLADRLGASPDKIEFLSAQADEFPAGDFGCPHPKQTPRPIPAFVSGQVIELAYAQTIYIYHTHGEQFAFCGPR